MSPGKPTRCPHKRLITSNFRSSIGLGGGSIVRQDSHSKRVIIGPGSVGHRITSEACVFNGATLSATDIAVAAGRASIGNVSRVVNLD